MVTTDWALTSADLLLFTVACESLDRMREMQRVIAAEGGILGGKGTMRRVHPATKLEKEARAALLAAFRQLGLEAGE